MIRANQKVTVPAKDNTTIYRLRYDDWAGYYMTISWTGNSIQ
jgi:hypothetical protein